METKKSSKSSNRKVLQKYEQNSKEQNSSRLSKHAQQCEKIQSKILKKILLAFSQICAHILFALFDGM